MTNNTIRIEVNISGRAPYAIDIYVPDGQFECVAHKGRDLILQLNDYIRERVVNTCKIRKENKND